MDPKNPIVPWLRSGAGASPADGGCVMQIVDWLSTEGWSDTPACVHPYLRRLAIAANDALPDSERQVLVDLIPRLMNTAHISAEVYRQLGIAAIEHVLPLFEPFPIKHRQAVQVLEAARRGEIYCRAVVDERPALVLLPVIVSIRTHDEVRVTVTVYAPGASHRPLELLLHVLAEYDRLVPREVSIPSYAKVCALAPAVAEKVGTCPVR